MNKKRRKVKITTLMEASRKAWRTRKRIRMPAKAPEKVTDALKPSGVLEGTGRLHYAQHHATRG